MKKTLLLFTLLTIFYFNAVTDSVAAPRSRFDDLFWGVLLVSPDDKLFSNDQIEISNLYPNPATDRVYFNYVFADAVVTAKITIRNVLGSVIEEKELLHGANKLEINIQQYVAGMYFYSLSINQKSVMTKRFMVKR